MGRLIQLELVNFKSYAGTTVIGPFDPFTSIIGPNGSGKSNLMDAISFVLGLPSSKLRSGNLSELVFHGSSSDVTGGDHKSKRKQAKVSALYEKDDKEQLLFTRTITGNTSEYFINNEPVLYAAYNQALEAENILVKARNFLVFQGDVETIAAKSPKELARLIEQISGSDAFAEEYDRAKQEHEKAIESSTFAFNKRRGLSAEIKAVQEQKEETVRFEELLVLRQDLVTDLYLHKLKQIEEHAHSLVSSIDTKQAALDSLEREHSKIEKKHKEARKEHARIMKEHAEVERQLQSVKSGDYSMNPEWIVLNEKSLGLDRQINTAKATIDNLQSELMKLETERAALEKELLVLNQVKAEKEKQLRSQTVSIPDNLKQEYEALQEQSRLQTSKEQLKIDALERKIAPQLVTKRQIEAKIEELELRRDQLSEESRTLNDRLNVTNAAFLKAQEAIDVISEKDQSKAKRLNDIEREEEECKQKLSAIIDRLLQIQAVQEESHKQATLREAVDTLKRIFPGVHGTLISLVQPTAKKYETSLLAVLGANADAVVCDNVSVAIECVKYLREHRIPPITFLPLDTLPNNGNSLLERTRHNVPEGCRLAQDLLRPTNQSTNIQRAIQYACGTALIADSLAFARTALNTVGDANTSKVVTVEGHILTRSGPMTGGQLDARTNSSKFEEEEVRKLRAEKDALLGVIGELQREAKRLDAVNNKAGEELIELEERMRFLSNEKAGLERKLKGVQDQLEFVIDQLEEKKGELRSVDANCSSSIKEIEELKVKMDNVAAGVFKDFTKRTGIKYADMEHSNAAVQKQLIDHEAQFGTLSAKLQSQIAFLQDTALKLQVELEESTLLFGKLVKERESVNFDLGKITQQQDLAKQNTANIEARLKEIDSKLEAVKLVEVKDLLQKINNGKQAAARDLSLAQIEIDKLVRERDSILRQCAMEQVYIPLLKGSLTDLNFANVIVDYGKVDKKLSIGQLESKLQSVNQEIDSLTPNLRALDKLEGAESRLKAAMDSFEKQRVDAKKARDAFVKVKQQRYNQFAPCFRHISEQIDRVYKALVGDSGTAYLSLEDVEEPYLEGVRFHAMPPGKRFMDMDALSGGEKTMAALALLFTLHTFKPAPFFILDEVDAALDNQNVQRLAQYLHKQRGNVQLIVISLKHRLYEQADALIGVYRTGAISKPLTLRLTDYDSGDFKDEAEKENLAV